jgi:predicted dehydrogenase
VEVPTHIAGVLDFASGPVGTIITSFDVPAKNNLPNIEIYGTGGTMRVPDPNGFADSDILINAPDDKEWRPISSPFGYAENSRGLGLADMSRAIVSGRPHRANGSLAYHVQDIMHAIHEASESGAHIELKTDMVRPDPLPEKLTFGQVPE